MSHSRPAQQPASRRRRHECGSASMEAILTLPFLFVILAMALILGRNVYLHLKVDAAGHFTATRYSLLRTLEGWDENGAKADARRSTTAAYFTGDLAGDLSFRAGALDLDRRRLEESRVDPDSETSLDHPQALTALGRIMSVVSGTEPVEVTLTRRSRGLPVGREVTDTFYIAGSSWPYAEVPLSVEGMTKVSSSSGNGLTAGLKNAIKWLAGGFLEFLGMKGTGGS